MIEDYQKEIIWLSTIKWVIEPTGGVPYYLFDEEGYKLLDDMLFKRYEEDGYVQRIHNEMMDFSKTNENIESFYLNKAKVESYLNEANLKSLKSLSLFFDGQFLAIITKYFKKWSENELQNLADRAKNNS